jgi:ribosomal protein L22
LKSLFRRCPSCHSTSPFSPSTFIRTIKTPSSAPSPGDRKAPKSTNPVLEQYLRAKPKTVIKDPELLRGAVAEDSIFEECEEAKAGYKQAEGDAGEDVKSPETVAPRNPENMANVLDPDPWNRMRWEKKQVIRQIEKRGRLTKAQVLKRTERESTTKSQLFTTSIKKLGMLARQIAGKPIEEAIVQMQFSKKGVAKDVKEHLEYARDMATVSRGLGLGKAEGKTGEPVEIQLKDGRRKLVKDRTGIYVDQAWVTKGPYQKSPEFRARGRVNLLYHPHTSKRKNGKLNTVIWLTPCRNFAPAEGRGDENTTFRREAKEEVEQEAMASLA